MDNESFGCCQNAVLGVELLQGKWKLRILSAMRSGPVRLGQLSRLIPSASKKVLTENLKQLEASGLVVRRDMTGNKAVRHVEYSLAKPIETATARLLHQLEEWNRATQSIASDSKPEHIR